MIYSAIKKSPFNFWGGLFNLTLGLIVAWVDGGFFESGRWVIWINLFAAIANLVTVYIVAKTGELDDYSVMINNLSEMTSNLENLKSFLEKEQSRVETTKLVIDNLEKDKAELEPVVNTYKETVKSIINAYDKKNRISVSRSLLFGFLIGVLSSFTASYLLNLLAD